MTHTDFALDPVRSDPSALSSPELVEGGDTLARTLATALAAKAFELLPELVGAFGVGLALWTREAAEHLRAVDAGAAVRPWEP